MILRSLLIVATPYMYVRRLHNGMSVCMRRLDKRISVSTCGPYIYARHLATHCVPTHWYVGVYAAHRQRHVYVYSRTLHACEAPRCTLCAYVGVYAAHTQRHVKCLFKDPTYLRGTSPRLVCRCLCGA